MADSITGDERKRKLQEIRNKAKSKDDSTVIGFDSSNVNDSNTDPANENDGTYVNNENETGRKIKFRNYQPYDPKLKELVNQPEIKEIQHNNDKSLTVIQVNNINNDKETDIIKTELSNYHNIKEINIIPKKLNWDLKVQVKDKLLKLKNKTQKAIVEILREKFAMSNENDE